MQGHFAKLVALLCIAVQAMLGGGIGLAPTSDIYPIPDSCGCTASCCNEKPKLPPCCSSKSEPAQPASCCCTAAPSRAPTQQAPRNDQSSSLKQVRFTPAPVTTLTWLPATLSPTRRVVTTTDTPATRTSCGITTTHIVV